MKKAFHPNVSIVIATYNNSKVLKKTLNGILMLNYPNKYEILVVNDGSTDDTKKVLKENFS